MEVETMRSKAWVSEETRHDTLPLPTTRRYQGDAPPAPLVAGPRVLIVDDVGVNRMIAAGVLSMYGYRCDEAASVTEALALLESRSYEAVLLDLDFGPSSRGGLDLLKTLRESVRWSTLPTIILTSHPEPQVEALHFGAQDYILKPFEPKVLEARVARAVRDHARLSALAATTSTIHQELAHAADVQRSCQPVVPCMHGRLAASGVVMSCGALGGDLFDVVVDTTGRMTVVVVDVAGHDAASAVVSSAVRIAARSALERGRDITDVLTAIDTCLKGYAGVLEGNAAVGLARFDEVTSTVEVVNAGLPPIVVRGPAGLRAIPSMSPPLGMAGAQAIEPRVLLVHPGTAVAIFTDGATGQAVDNDSVVALAERAGLGQFGATLALARPEQLTTLIREWLTGSLRDDATIAVAGMIR